MTTSARVPSNRHRGLQRWIAANVGTAIPQSMAPITFGLVSLSQGDVNGGALMMTAMTVAQVLGAVPLAAAGRRWPVTVYARMLTAVRTLAFVGLTLAVSADASLPVLVAVASVAGVVNGAIFGVLRAVLSDVVTEGKLPRALGFAATANELVFVTGPILASIIGGISVLGSVAVMTAASVLPVVAFPRVPHRRMPRRTRTAREAIPMSAVVWLLASAGAGACVSSIEVGAVALALRAGLGAGAALLFTVPLCVASTLGGMWVTVRNRRLPQRTMVALLLLSALGMLAVAWVAWIVSAIVGAVLVGLALAPLDMSFSLSIDDTLPSSRRAEGFALLRTSRGAGLIIVSSVIAFGSPESSLVVSAALASVSATVIAATQTMRART